MKVAVVVNCLKLGGMERVAVNLADAFAKQGDEAHLIYLKDRKVEVKPQMPEVKVRLFNVRRLVLQTGIGVFWLIICQVLNLVFRKSFPLFFAWAQAQAFKYKLRQLEAEVGAFDLIIFRGQGTFGQVWPLKDPRFVFVSESTTDSRLYGGFSRVFFKWLYQDRQVVCVSEGAKVTFEQMVDRYHIHCRSVHKISNPNDYDQIRQTADVQAANECHPRPYILGLGRLVPMKRFSLLIEAYAYARKTFGLSQDLVIVGEGRDRAVIEEKIQALQLQDCVFLKGQQSNPYPWFRHADLFVLSSQSEGLGMVLIEALACGTPVVSVDCPGGVRDIMQGQLSHFLSAETLEALAEKIQQGLAGALADEHVLVNEEPSTDDTASAVVTPYWQACEQDIDKTLMQFDQAYIVNQYKHIFLSGLRS
ncbi:glycosyl transferase [Terasakiispira papahanaumokuakeensis]|uniref:Glycosyl transferase n=1 Tax=Terasakiispira papahanaumokuakeensis TaxID=197479 RepID=A0A1E2V882_9GAMM|nr:glycosyltransferase [Terasakiispira papahanaumokuakeensis]ODC03197.1 glycosyl transferase [Terasakiispira papahanaumokuakeensis]